ncbi:MULTISPECIES: 4-hydroxyphenylacetate 3-hydroxylase family protein [unclassified Undibacterium]|uniref:4-hydroxyphenylacetate 3-hydroxylase family protein n=1 Tax=unclassified Undibacterium TaxID=2630295 RepID=UPI002AC9C8AD|nr:MULTISPECIES: 4-hydroxyphenylacetate 3-hydroxylase N-terminal domain-containing protein [unclassified Undibacterium]MEB0138385.1 4-hydroxyphenylacetate 3-hydroxylase N-terminal domain-containing protein [Undibacterium sp. CCC2.1]MEB0171260.1 4-hydroxyphenylacetate 3-hydroxylase N-terminal domain-containing protein [Undibacterium sp. CCC1.1]MEB0176618.1 4-hydroxyphenylacetate 3-hydroxylase N-terminal domain-containing protein [Undibacterium sp. CCC3.4]MEB0214013.1 4-hydroxyphenylacetate 3-hyd
MRTTPFCQLDYQLDMRLDHASGALTGPAYLDSLDDAREVWLDGQRVRVTEHPAFAGLRNEMARLYDLQHSEACRDAMTETVADTPYRVSRSYSLPHDEQRLEAKWANSHLWMKHSWGQLPRVPDFMANVVIGLYDYRAELAVVDPQFGANAAHYHAYCSRHDLSITHAIGDPQIDRSSGPLESADLALRVVKETPEGVVIRGAKQLATMAPFAHEVLIYMSPTFAMRDKPEFVIWCALPMQTPGLRIMCREALARPENSFSHPFASRYDEQDAMLFFDDVFVPRNRIFLLNDSKTAFDGFRRLNAWSLYVGQIRFYHRMRTHLAVAAMVCEAIGVSDFREVQGKLGELTTYVEMARLALLGMQRECSRTAGGMLAPSSTLGPDTFAAQFGTRASEILRELGASGLLMQPSEADLANPELRPLLERYMRGKDIDVNRKSRLFRMAWDLTCDSYGMRQELYEKWNRGDLARNRIALFKQFDRSELGQRILDAIADPEAPAVPPAQASPMDPTRAIPFTAAQIQIGHQQRPVHVVADVGPADLSSNKGK